MSRTFRASRGPILRRSEVHIKYTGRKYEREVALLDRQYDELWVDGKASYKVGSMIEEGG